jgi:hypothetical protein
LVYGEKLCSTRLFHSKCRANAASNSGSYVGWFANDRFSIFEATGYKPIPVCSGRFKKKHYYYGPTEGKCQLTQFDNRNVSPFCRAALSDYYIAVGTDDGMILVFAVQEETPGQWLCSADTGGAVIEKLVFSPQGEELLAVLTTRDRQQQCQKVIVFPTSGFAKARRVADEAVKHLTSSNTVAEWRNSDCEIHAAVFSSDGRKFAICTSHDNRGYSQIRLLKKSGRDGRWRKQGVDEVPVVQAQDSTSAGITGISLYIPPLLS